MCLYFSENWEKTYFVAPVNEIGHVTGGSGLTILAPATFYNGIRYDLTLDRSSESTYDLRLDIFENTEKTASLWQKGLPDSIVGDMVHHQKNDLMQNYLSNSTQMLFKNTYLAAAISRMNGVSYFPSLRIKQFLNDALTVTTH